MQGQRRLLEASVHVVGSGAAAEEATRYLVGAGVGTLVVDPGLLARHGEAWVDLNDEVVMSSSGTGEHRLEVGGSDSRLTGVQAALRLLVSVAVEAR